MRWLGIAILLWTVVFLIAMKRYEADFDSPQGKFTIMKLELPQDQIQLRDFLTELSPKVVEAAQKNIYFDFPFLLGIFGFVAWICGAVGNVHRRLGNARLSICLLVLAGAQVVAALLDITEDVVMLGWLSNPAEAILPWWFKPMVLTKFFIAFAGVLLSILSLSFTFERKPIV